MLLELFNTFEGEDVMGMNSSCLTQGKPKALK